MSPLSEMSIAPEASFQRSAPDRPPCRRLRGVTHASPSTATPSAATLAAVSGTSLATSPPTPPAAPLDAPRAVQDSSPESSPEVKQASSAQSSPQHGSYEAHERQGRLDEASSVSQASSLQRSRRSFVRFAGVTAAARARGQASGAAEPHDVVHHRAPHSPCLRDHGGNRTEGHGGSPSRTAQPPAPHCV
uniref:Uncharacterized protein n=1 Tax=Haptolina brevifila TaxID=156173 RepID=A0A7S2HAC7_9EUKA